MKLVMKTGWRDSWRMITFRQTPWAMFRISLRDSRSISSRIAAKIKSNEFHWQVFRKTDLQVRDFGKPHNRLCVTPPRPGVARTGGTHVQRAE